MKRLRIDLTHGAQGTAYVGDSSFGTTPALVVVDLATGKARRVLLRIAVTEIPPELRAFYQKPDTEEAITAIRYHRPVSFRQRFLPEAWNWLSGKKGIRRKTLF